MTTITDSTQDAAPTAGMVVIGNEILSGKTEDTNAPYLCRELRFLGVDLQRILTIPDDFDLIAASVRDFSESFTWVFTSGGIGPTHDDLTIPAIASGFGVPVVKEPRLEEALRTHYQGRLTEEHLRMALLPQGSELIEVSGLSYPQIIFRNIFILPGVPELFRYKFNGIKNRFSGTPIVLRQVYLKADEGSIARLLKTTAENHPDVLIGSYPSFFREEYSVKVTLEARAGEAVGSALDELQGRLNDVSAKVVKVT